MFFIDFFSFRIGNPILWIFGDQLYNLVLDNKHFFIKGPFVLFTIVRTHML